MPSAKELEMRMAKRMLILQWMSGLNQIIKKVVSAKQEEYRQLKALFKMGIVQDPALSISHSLSFKSAGPLQRGKQEPSSTVVFYPGCVFKSLVDFLNMLCLITADQLNQH